jgi:orotidine-5'-phosphate decarboxylase
VPLQARTDLQTLEELCRTRREIDDRITEQVAALSGLGADWGVIGRALGVTRQAARQRYGGRTP